MMTRLPSRSEEAGSLPVTPSRASPRAVLIARRGGPAVKVISSSSAGLRVAQHPMGSDAGGQRAALTGPFGRPERRCVGTHRTDEEIPVIVTFAPPGMGSEPPGNREVK